MLFSKIVSLLFHPLLLPIFGLFLIFNLEELSLSALPGEMRIFLYAATTLFTFFLPLLTALLLLRFKIILSLEMKTCEERRIPFLAAGIYYCALLFLLSNMGAPPIISALMLGATLLVLGILIVNFFWKISAHMAGIGGLIGIMIALSARMQVNMIPIFIILFFLAGFIGFSRLLLSAHKPAQVYAGFLLGIFIELLLLLPGSIKNV